RDVVLQRKQCHCLVRGGRATKELDELTTLSRVLVGECRELAACCQYMLDLFEVALLGEDRLPRLLPETQQKPIEVGVVEGARDRVSLEAEHSQGIACDLPVTQVACHEHQGPVREQCLDDFPAADQLCVVLPVVSVQLAGKERDLHHHRAKVNVNLAHHAIALFG